MLSIVASHVLFDIPPARAMVRIGHGRTEEEDGRCDKMR